MSDLIEELDALQLRATTGNAWARDEFLSALEVAWPELRARLLAAETERDEAIEALRHVCAHSPHSYAAVVIKEVREWLSVHRVAGKGNE